MLSAIHVDPSEAHGPLRTPLLWLYRVLFSSWWNALGTLVLIGLLCLMLSKLLDWAVFDATFAGSRRNSCTGPGACWPFVGAHLAQFVYGRYPTPERWR